MSHNFVNDRRFAEFKVNGYLNAGKPKRYIEQKLKQKGIDEKTISSVFEEANYSEKDTALNFAQKKKSAVSETARKNAKTSAKKISEHSFGQDSTMILLKKL